LKRLGNELLEEGVKRVEESGGRVTGTHLVEGRAADEILDLAERIGADLVVIGSRGFGAVGRIALGSVSEAVIHHSRCPVLLLRGGEDSWPPERVIFGDDGSEAARAAGDLGASLCGRHGARALLLHAYPRLPEVDAEGREFNPRIVDDELRRGENALLGRSRELEAASARAQSLGWWLATRRPAYWRPPRRTMRRRGPCWPWAVGVWGRSDG
jgi:nucleotide-binding universal stress UspA family protein